LICSVGLTIAGFLEHDPLRGKSAPVTERRYIRGAGTPNACSTSGITSAGYEYQYQSNGPLTGSSASAICDRRWISGRRGASREKRGSHS
jgi:hypothetical protein